ncbi:MAG: 50S ribosomal protein L4 [Desulfococcus sp.]|nr:MAG: 50S ribosomal protein L4 [Desulfococcus sp.]
MAVVDVLNVKGEKVSQVELSDDVFNVPVKSSILHDVVTQQLAARRKGTAAVKRRGDIKGSTRKLFRQKGTGRARRGSIKSPLLKGGGVVFGPSPKSWAYELPKKVRRLALRMALSSKLQNERLAVLDEFRMTQIKTREFAGIMAHLGWENALVVIPEKDEKMELSSRNLKQIKVIRSEGLNVYDILKYQELVLLEPSIKAVEGRLIS